MADDLKKDEKLPSKVRSACGGITCCVPDCFNNSRKTSGVSFYVFPKDPSLRKKWIQNIERENFTPTSHRMCSAHFEGGKKTYMNNIPTVFSAKENCEKPNMTPEKPNAFPAKGNVSTTPTHLQLFRPTARALFNKENVNDVSVQTVTSEELLRQQVQELNEKILAMELQYKEKLEDLQGKISSLQDTLNRTAFSIDRFKDDPSLMKFYTGFPDYDTFKIFFHYLGPAVNNLVYWGSNTNSEKIDTPFYKKHGRKRSTSPEQELFIVLARLRCGLLEEDIAVRCNMSVSHVSRICITWIDFLHCRLRALPVWASKETIRHTMPNCFKEMYPDTRVILDCTEIFIQMPTSFRSQSATFSSYKHHNTAKGLVGIAPNGAITYVSDLYTGRISDKQIVKDCGILNLLENGDNVMADRGFDVESDLPEGVSLNIPPFMNGKDQLSLEEETETRRIASVRIHVERAIERIKNFHILQSVYPINMAAELNKIWIICSYICNFLPPLVCENSKK